jgi:hypothetical protein
LLFKEGRMLVASTFGFNYNLTPPALGERRHRGLARRFVAERRRAIPVLPVGQSPQGASFGAARSVDMPRFIPIIVPTAGRGHWDVARPGVEFSEKEKTLPVQG